MKDSLHEVQAEICIIIIEFSSHVFIRQCKIGAVYTFVSELRVSSRIVQEFGRGNARSTNIYIFFIPRAP